MGPSSVLMSFVLLLYLADASSPLDMRLRGRHALFPPEGEQEELQKREPERHPAARVSLATATAKRDHGTRTTLPTLRRSVIIVWASPASEKLNSPATTGSIVPSSISRRSAPVTCARLRSSWERVSMFRPITALDADICLIMLKRGMRSTVRSAETGLRRWPVTSAEAPKATSRPPGPSMS